MSTPTAAKPSLLQICRPALVCTITSNGSNLPSCRKMSRPSWDPRQSRKWSPKCSFMGCRGAKMDSYHKLDLWSNEDNTGVIPETLFLINIYRWKWSQHSYQSDYITPDLLFGLLIVYKGKNWRGPLLSGQHLQTECSKRTNHKCVKNNFLF